MFRLLVTLGLLAVVSSRGLHGAVILSEAFSYPDGVLQAVSADKWTGHSGTTNQVDVSGGALNLSGSETQDVNALLVGQPYSSTGSDRLYSSFKVKFTLLPSSGGSYFAHFKDSGGGFRARLWALGSGATPGLLRLGVGSASGTVPSLVHPLELKVGSEYRVVTCLIVSNAVSSLWINPDSEAAPSVATEPGAAIQISAYAFRQATGIGVLTIDDLLVGTTFADVIPSSNTPAVVTNPVTNLPPVVSGPVTNLPPIVGVPTTNLPSVVTSPTTNLPPVITSYPLAQSVREGGDATFRAEAQGGGPLIYQWRLGGVAIPGATNSVFTLTKVTLREQGDYRVIVSNSFGTATSPAATLIVIGLEFPTIAKQPANQTVSVGDNAVFSVVARGTEPLAYQWQYNQVDVPGANSPTFTLPRVTASQAGKYSVTVINIAGSLLSEIATLAVDLPAAPPPPNVVRASRPPAIQFTNVLENLIRKGDAPTNTFTELALQPGEKLTVEVLISVPESRDVTLIINSNDLPASASWVLSGNNGSSLGAKFIFMPTPAEAGTSYAVILQAINEAGTNHVVWNIYVPNEVEQQIVLNEFLANPTGTATAPHFNPLNRAEPAPNPSSNDEYIELVNLSRTDVDLLHWTISDSAQVRHRFKETFMILSSNAVVVYGGPASGFPPVLDVPATPASESALGLGLNNSGGDSILIRNARSNLISRVVFAGLPTTGSLTRHPDFNDGFVAHSTISTQPSSPGRRSKGQLFKERTPIEPSSLESAPINVSPLRATVTFDAPSTIVLRWDAAPGQVYTVFRSSTPSGPFIPMSVDLSFADENGRYEDRHWESRPTSFYKIGRR